jgi:multidrug efflux system membrane fusion protein
MFCRAKIVLQTLANAVIISRDCLVENGETKQVYAVEDGKIAVHEVKIGASGDNDVQILSGVKPGDKLVRSGQTLLAKGQAVKPTEQGAGAEATSQAPQGVEGAGSH